MHCAICQKTSTTRYQCCLNDKHSLCESCCINIVSCIINNGKIGLLFTGKIPCYSCNGKFQCDRLPASLQSTLNDILLTIPKTSKNPQRIEEFHYYYDQLNQLRHCRTKQKFIFITQRHYELLGKAIEIYIQSMIKSEPWNYEEMWLPIGNQQQHQVNIFVSNDFRTNDHGCLILIQGCGVVRAGQWSRSCCINESLDIGAMFPYMAKAKENNLSVIILNPNQTSFIDEEKIFDHKKQISSEDLHSFYLSSEPLPRPSSEPIPNLSTSREHILYVYDNIISQFSPARRLYFVAHSAGGDHLMYLLRQRQDLILPKLAKIAFTDSMHSTHPSDTNEIKNFLQSNAIHFIASSKPMGQTLHCFEKPICPEVSAGHLKHEYTCGYCIKGVFDFFFRWK